MCLSLTRHGKLGTDMHLTLNFSRAASLLNTTFNNQVENDGDEGPGWVKETLMAGWRVMRRNKRSNIEDLDESQQFMA